MHPLLSLRTLTLYANASPWFNNAVSVLLLPPSGVRRSVKYASATVENVKVCRVDDPDDVLPNA